METEMREDLNDPELVDKIVNTIKSKGIFDQFRKDCLADVDTKPAYQNLQRRVSGSVNAFLNNHKWPCAQNKTQLRESVRKHTVKQSFLESGVDRIVDQVVMPKIYSVFHPKVEEIVYEMLGLEKPKPKPKPKPDPKSLLDLKLDFQNFKKSLNESISSEKKSVRDASLSPSSTHNEEPQGLDVKEEEDSQPNYPDAANTPPPLETNGESVTDAHQEVIASSPASQKSVLEVLNNDDDSNTIDEMPLLVAPMDTSNNRATTPVLNTIKNDSIFKVDSSSDSDSHSLPSSYPPMELDSSTNNLSSLKSDLKDSPSKKFDNFSNLGEKLKQSDVNLRETTLVRADEITEESSEVTKSSEHDSESIDLNMELHSDSNPPATDSSRNATVHNETLASSQYSDDSMSSAKSKSKSQDIKKEDKTYNHKQMSENIPKSTLPDAHTGKVEKYEERSGQKPEGDKVEQSKSSSKYSDSKSRHTDISKDKSKSRRHRYEKHRSKDGPNPERNGKYDSGKDNDDVKGKTDADSEKKISKQKNDGTKLASEDSDRKNKKEERSRHDKEDRDSRSSKKREDHAKGEDKEKEKFKTPEKEKKGDDKSRSDRSKAKSASSSKSSHSKSDDRKSRDERKKDDKNSREDDKNDKKDRDDDKKKDSRKRKSGKCDESDSKSKNSRRSSDRDSNGNAGGGSDKPKPASSSQTHRKSSKSEQKTRSKYKDPSNSDALEDDESVQVTDEVDLILLQINNSIENEQHRLDVREILNEPSVNQAIKPKIAKNFHEIRKIMQARKNINKLIGNDAALGPSNETELETLASKADIFQDNEKELSYTEPSADDDDDDVEKTCDGVDKIELKDLSVVIKDVMKCSLKTALDSNLDLTSNIGVSIFLGSNNEIVRVEQCSVESENRSDESGSPSPTKESPSENMLLNIKTTEIPIPSDLVHSCADVSKEASLKENVMEPCGTPEEDKVGGDVIPLAAREPTNEPICTLTGPASLDTTSVETSVKGDDDESSIKSERSETSHLSEKDIVDCVETTDTDFKSARKPDPVSKQNSTDCTPLPSRCTTRKNAGTRMYAILEEVSSSKHSNSPSDRGVKKMSKSRSNSDAERHSRPDSPNVAFEKGEPSSVAIEASSSKDGTDDGSDLSNKENDETSASGTGRLKNQKVDQSAMVETRSTRKRNPVLDKPDDNTNPCKPGGGKTCGTKTRVSLSSKNATVDPETASDDDDLEKPCIDLTAKPNTRWSTASLSGEVRDSDEQWLLKANPPSSCKVNDTVRKSLECLQMEKENFTVLRITTSQSSEPNPPELTPSPRRKSCPDILHPRDHCDNKYTAKDRCPTPSEGVVPGSNIESCNDAKQTDDSAKSKTAAIKLSKTNDVPQRQFEYYTRNINNRRKSIVNDKGDKKQDDSTENKKPTIEYVKSKTQESDLSCKSQSVTQRRTSEKIDGKITSDHHRVTTRRRNPKVIPSELVNNNDCSELSGEEGKSRSDARCTYVGKFSENTLVTDSVVNVAQGNPNSTGETKAGENMEDQKLSTSGEKVTTQAAVEQMTQSEVPGSSYEQLQKSARFLNKKSPSSVPEEEPPNSVLNVNKGLTLRRKQKTGWVDESETKLKEDDEQSSKPVITANVNERPKRKICLPSWRCEDTFVPLLPPKAEGFSKSNNSIVADAEIASVSKQAVESDGEPKNRNKRPSKRTASTCEKSRSEGSEDFSADSASNGPVRDSQSCLAVRNSNNEPNVVMNISAADSTLDDSSSGSGFEFRGFSEEDAQPDSDVECFGFSDEEIEKAAVQLRLLTHFIANRHRSLSKSCGTSQPQVKKTRVSSEGTEHASNGKEAASQAMSKAARKRQLSLSSTPEKDKKGVLVGQCKAESKDSGLCESPEQPSFASNIGQKTISVDHRTPVNGSRTKPVRTPASRPERNKTENLTKIGIAKTRNSQRYCASDLYKPRPSFARDVRAVKRTSSPQASTLGRAKKRSR